MLTCAMATPGSEGQRAIRLVGVVGENTTGDGLVSGPLLSCATTQEESSKRCVSPHSKSFLITPDLARCQVTSSELPSAEPITSSIGQGVKEWADLDGIKMGTAQGTMWTAQGIM